MQVEKLANLDECAYNSRVEHSIAFRLKPRSRSQTCGAPISVVVSSSFTFPICASPQAEAQHGH